MNIFSKNTVFRRAIVADRDPLRYLCQVFIHYRSVCVGGGGRMEYLHKNGENYSKNKNHTAYGNFRFCKMVFKHAC